MHSQATKRHASTGISHTILIAAQSLRPRLQAQAVADAIASGLQDGGLPEPDRCPLQERLDHDFDARMRQARAVVIASPRLDESTLLGSLPFEIATRARQAGVPCYAVTAEDALSPFDRRILDLQLVLRARSRQTLAQAGLRIAEVAH